MSLDILICIYHISLLMLKKKADFSFLLLRYLGQDISKLQNLVFFVSLTFKQREKRRKAPSFNNFDSVRTLILGLIKSCEVLDLFNPT